MIYRHKAQFAYTNKTGAPSVKGSLVTAAAGGTAGAPGVALAGEFNAIGVVETAGVPDGGTIMVTVAGPTQVLLKDGEASTAGYVAFSSDTPGRAKTAAVPVPPNSDSHFTEIGHVHETAIAGTNVLIWVTVHFN